MVILGSVCGLALLDLSTGEFRATEFAGGGAWASAVDELGRVRPVELLYGEGLLGGVSRQAVLRDEKQKRKRFCAPRRMTTLFQ